MKATELKEIIKANKSKLSIAGLYYSIKGGTFIGFKCKTIRDFGINILKSEQINPHAEFHVQFTVMASAGGLNGSNSL